MIGNSQTFTTGSIVEFADCLPSALYVLVKALPRVCTEIQHEGACRETNTARGEAECCIFRTHELRRCFNCYIAFLVLSGPI